MTFDISYFRTLDTRILAQQARWGRMQLQQTYRRDRHAAAALSCQAHNPMHDRAWLLSDAAGFRVLAYVSLLAGDRKRAREHRHSAAAHMRQAITRARA